MFLVFNHYGEHSFDIAYVKDDDHQTLQAALDNIGGYHDLYLSDDNEVYDIDEMNEEDFENKNFDDYSSIGSVEVYDNTFLTIDGEIQ